MYQNVLLAWNSCLAKHWLLEVQLKKLSKLMIQNEMSLSVSVVIEESYS